MVSIHGFGAHRPGRLLANLRKRITPEEVAAIQAAGAAAAAATTSAAIPTVANPPKTIPNPNTSTPAVAPAPAPAKSTNQNAPPAAPIGATSSAAVTSAAKPTSAVVKTTSPVTSAPHTSAVHTTPPTTTDRAVPSVSSVTPSSQTSSSVTHSASTAANNDGASKGLTNGAVAGIVICVLLVLIGILIAASWFWKRYRSRDYTTKSPWARMDEDITPFPKGSGMPDNEKVMQGHAQFDDYPSASNMANQNHALALARQNAFYADGTMRPDSAVMHDGTYGASRSLGPYPNMAGGAGRVPMQQAGYPQQNPVYMQPSHQQLSQNSFDPRGSSPENPFDDGVAAGGSAAYMAAASSGPRQLVGPNYQAAPMPVPLGRPSPPQTYDEIAHAEMYADDRYADDYTAMPPSKQSGHSMPPQPQPPIGHSFYGSPTSSDAHSLPDNVPLPTLAPMSPLMTGFGSSVEDPHPSTGAAAVAGATAALTRAGPAAAAAQAPVVASVPVPVVSAPAPAVTTAAPAEVEHLPPQPTRLPPPTMTDLPAPVIPYQHGQPLSPLREVPTPKSEKAPLMPVPPAIPQETRKASRPLPTPPTQAKVPSALATSSLPPAATPNVPVSASTVSLALPATDAVPPSRAPSMPLSVGTSVDGVDAGHDHAQDAYGGI